MLAMGRGCVGRAVGSGRALGLGDAGPPRVLSRTSRRAVWMTSDGGSCRLACTALVLPLGKRSRRRWDDAGSGAVIEKQMDQLRVGILSRSSGTATAELGSSGSPSPLSSAVHSTRPDGERRGRQMEGLSSTQLGGRRSDCCAHARQLRKGLCWQIDQRDREADGSRSLLGRVSFFARDKERDPRRLRWW